MLRPIGFNTATSHVDSAGFIVAISYPFTPSFVVWMIAFAYRSVDIIFELMLSANADTYLF